MHTNGSVNCVGLVINFKFDHVSPYRLKNLKENICNKFPSEILVFNMLRSMSYMRKNLAGRLCLAVKGLVFLPASRAMTACSAVFCARITEPVRIPMPGGPTSTRPG